MIYRSLIRPVLFQLEPEMAHALTIRTLHLFEGRIGFEILKKLFGNNSYESKPVELLSLKFPNRLGLAAGADKDCLAPGGFTAMGFGHIELGSIVSMPRIGNPKPRMFRFPKELTIVNALGFPSEGLDNFVSRLTSFRSWYKEDAIIGVNIGKPAEVPLEQASDEYCNSFKRLAPLGDYFCINISSPNTPDLRKLQDKDKLVAIINALQALNTLKKPIIVKVSPDLTLPQLDDLLDGAIATNVSGIVATNTTITRTGLPKEANQLKGGMSGKLLHNRSLEIIRHIRAHTKLPVIGCGGVDSYDSYMAMREAGADIVQIYTGLIYNGPGLINNILRECQQNRS